MHNKFTFCTLFLSLIFFYGCVDEKYDLGKIDGDMNPLGNFVSLPLGATKAMNLDDMFKDVDEIKANPETGEYYATYTSASTIPLPSEDDITIDPINIGLNTDLQLADQSGIVSFDLESTSVASSDFELNFQDGSSLKELYDASLDTDNGYSNIDIHIVFNGLDVRSGEANANVKIEFPQSFNLSDTPHSNGNIFSTDIDLKESRNVSYQLKLDKMGKSNNPDIPDEYTVLNEIALTIRQGADITVNSPTAKIDIVVDNIRFITVYGRFDINETTKSNIDMANFYDFVSDDPANKFSFAEPRLFITSRSNIGTGLNASLKFVTSKNNVIQNNETSTVFVKPSVRPFEFKTNDFGFGPVALPDWSSISDNPWKELDLSEMLKDMPDLMQVDVEAYVKPADCDPKTSFLTKGMEMAIDYRFEIPFILGEDFHMVFKDTLRDVFDEDMRKLLFTENVNPSVKDSIVFYGEVESSIPLAMNMELIPMDENENEITGINLGKQIVEPSPDGTTIKVSKVSFSLDRGDYAAMRRAVHFKALFTATTGQASNVPITDKSTIQAILKIKKWGGFTVN